MKAGSQKTEDRRGEREKVRCGEPVSVFAWACGWQNLTVFSLGNKERRMKNIEV
jgi:hypothetical protein